MKRARMNRIGIGSWMCGLGLLAAATGPAMAADISIGGFFGKGGRDGVAVGGFVRIGDPAPQPVVVAPPAAVVQPVVVPPPVIVERVWVSTPRIVYREVPVIDACGRVIAYRQEREVIPDGHWETITRPAPVPCVTPAPVVVRQQSRLSIGVGVSVRHNERDRHEGGRGFGPVQTFARGPMFGPSR